MNNVVRTGTPLEDANMVCPWGLVYVPRFDGTVALSIPVRHPDGGVIVRNQELTLESFYELREAVNDLYDHIRQENP